MIQAYGKAGLAAADGLFRPAQGVVFRTFDIHLDEVGCDAAFRAEGIHGRDGNSYTVVFLLCTNSACGIIARIRREPERAGLRPQCHGNGFGDVRHAVVTECPFHDFQICRGYFKGKDLLDVILRCPCRRIAVACAAVQHDVALARTDGPTLINPGIFILTIVKSACVAMVEHAGISFHMNGRQTCILRRPLTILPEFFKGHAAGELTGSLPQSQSQK